MVNFPPPTACDYVLLTAVSSERDAIKTAAKALGVPYKNVTSSLGQYADLGSLGADKIRLISVHAGTMGPLSVGGSAATASRWLAATQAQAVISVGMAFSTLPAQHILGDVLVSDSLLPYDYRIVRCANAGAPETDYSDVSSYKPHQPLLRLLETASQRRGSVSTPAVHIGPMLSGSARIHCSTFRDELRDELGHHGVPVGGDMEGIGLLFLGTKWIVVKGISDFADEDRDKVIDSSRPIACLNAARFVLEALQ